MAHASAIEKAKTQMKKLRKQKADKRSKMAQEDITYEERQAKQAKRFEKTLKEEVDMAIYDYEHHQYPTTKYAVLRDILDRRLTELRAEIKIKPDLSDEYSIEEKYVYNENRKKKLYAYIEKLEGVLNEINRT